MKDLWSPTSAVAVEFILLTLHLKAVDATEAEGCGKGFFGKKCRYQCHCLDDDKCDKVTGDCGDSKCSKGYFDNACQVYDSFARYSKHKSGDVNALSDGDNTTCISGRKSYKGEYEKPIPFSRMRLVFQYGSNAQTVGEGMKVEMNNDNCEHTTEASENTLDFFCGPGDVIEITSFTLTFHVQVQLCALHTSYGIDLALKTTDIKVSSVYQSNETDYGKSFAVDGDERAIMSSSVKNKCFHSTEEKEPYLQVFFHSAARILGVYIVNRRDKYLDRLRGFVLETLEDNKPKQRYTDPEKYGLETYDIPFLPEDGCYGMALNAKIRLPHSGKSYLTVCEIRYFGEYFSRGPCLTNLHCIPGMKCRDEVCESPSAYVDNPNMCTLCPSGFYGANCSQQCPENCHTGVCHRENGTCTEGCKDHFSGSKCDIIPFGKECMNDSSHCRGSLMCLNGTCRCKEFDRHDPITDKCADPLTIGAPCEATGFLMCTLPGMYCDGLECTCNITTHYKHFIDGGSAIQQCFPKINLGSACTYIKGECGQNTSCIRNKCACHQENQFWNPGLSQCEEKKDRLSPCIHDKECVDNFTCIDGHCALEMDVSSSKREYYKDCPDGMFGMVCEEKCPINCERKLCFKSNGTCINGCRKGSFGATCEQKCPSSCMASICTLALGICSKGCTVGQFGEKCDKKCPFDCQDNMCDQSTGDCERDSDIWTWIFAITGCAITVLGLSMWVVAGLQKERVEASQEQESEE